MPTSAKSSTLPPAASNRHVVHTALALWSRTAASNHGASMLLLAIGLGSFIGCRPAPPADAETTFDAAPAASNVPLRIRVVGGVESPEVIERRWLSSSEQPIDIQSQSVEAFLANDSSQADVILFPARLIGELVQRDWITKLPVFESASAVEAEEGSVRNFPPAWQAQCTYGGATYALPLGCSITRFVASDSLAKQLQGASDERELKVSFQVLVDTLAASEPAQATEPLQLADIDPQALVDRFLTLAFAATQRNPIYGVVLDLETMQPRLMEPEFVQAAQVLLKMSAQAGGGRQATVSTHADAWQWAATQTQHAVAISTATQLSPAATTITSGAIIELGDGTVLNTGGGLIAAIATECRQSHHSKLFLQWLREPQTAVVLAPLILGVDSPQPSALDALSWRAQQRLMQVALNDQLPQELRIAGAFKLRAELADELLAMLNGSKSPVAALEAAQKRWRAMIEPNRDAVKLEYQLSLGLKER